MLKTQATDMPNVQITIDSKSLICEHISFLIIILKFTIEFKSQSSYSFFHFFIIIKRGFQSYFKQNNQYLTKNLYF